MSLISCEPCPTPYRSESLERQTDQFGWGNITGRGNCNVLLAISHVGDRLAGGVGGQGDFGEKLAGRFVEGAQLSGIERRIFVEPAPFLRADKKGFGGDQ